MQICVLRLGASVRDVKAKPRRIRVARASRVAGDRDLVVEDAAITDVLDQDLRRAPRPGLAVKAGDRHRRQPQRGRIDRLADEVGVAATVTGDPRVSHAAEPLRPTLTCTPRHVRQLRPRRRTILRDPGRKATRAAIRPAVLLRGTNDLIRIQRVHSHLRLDLGAVIGAGEVSGRAGGTTSQAVTSADVQRRADLVVSGHRRARQTTAPTQPRRQPGGKRSRTPSSVRLSGHPAHRAGPTRHRSAQRPRQAEPPTHRKARQDRTSTPTAPSRSNRPSGSPRASSRCLSARARTTRPSAAPKLWLVLVAVLDQPAAPGPRVAESTRRRAQIAGTARKRGQACDLADAECGMDAE